jgi:hypothetical protein
MEMDLVVGRGREKFFIHSFVKMPKNAPPVLCKMTKSKKTLKKIKIMLDKYNPIAYNNTRKVQRTKKNT